MTDFSNMSDEELLAAYRATPATAVKAPKLSPQDSKQLMTVRQSAQANAAAARDADRFIDINQRVGTGEIWGLPFASEVREKFDPDFATLQSLTNRMAPLQRQPGSGSSSDKDVAGFKRSVPNPDFPGPTNANIAGRLKSEAERAQEYAAFLDQYASERGTLLGAEAEWAKRPQPTATPPRKPIQSAIKPEGLTPEQRRAAQAFRGTQANSGTAQNPSIPANKDQFDRLPKGTYFIAPDGSVRIKP